MINKKLTYAAIALLTLGFASCQQEEDFAPQGGGELEIRVAFTTDAMKTRVNTLESGDTWENGDELCFSRRMESGNQTEYSLTATVTDDVIAWTSSEKLYWNGEGIHYLFAAYPCVIEDNWEDFVIPADQSTLKNLKNADFMNARWAGNPTTEVINFHLKHRLSMVTVNYIFASEFEEEPSMTPEIYSKSKYAMFSNTNDFPITTILHMGGMWIKAYKHGEKKFTAIVTPDAYSAGDDFIRINVEGEQLIAKMQEDITFKEGTHYTFDLKVGKDKVILTPTTTDADFPGGWNNDSEVDLN